MANKKIIRLNRGDWIRRAFELLLTTGIEGVKIVPLAKSLGATSGSFYWHFSNRRELHEALLEYWEREMTDVAIDAARAYEGTALDRILNLMVQVMETGMAGYDLAIWHWANTDESVQVVFQRTLEKRFEFATWMFKQAGFTRAQAEIRGRMMVVYMMGESTLVPGTPDKRKRQLRMKFDVLTGR
ncbi:MAG: TetR/AcrR family transcriptional regulator [Gammaproteobacteria bacterium]|nr:TetR/AcrR family transcriptional regulator [Gammaproteobacteria bacterium]